MHRAITLKGILVLNCSRVVKFCLWGKTVRRALPGLVGKVQHRWFWETPVSGKSQAGLCSCWGRGLESSGSNSIIRALISFRQILNSFAWLREAASAFHPVPFSAALQKAESKIAPEELFVTQRDLKCCLYKKLVLSLWQNSPCPDKPPGSRLHWGFFIYQKVKHTGGGFWVWCTGRATRSCWVCAMWPITTHF